MRSYHRLLCTYKDSSFVRKSIFFTSLIYMGKLDKLQVLEKPGGP